MVQQAQSIPNGSCGYPTLFRRYVKCVLSYLRVSWEETISEFVCVVVKVMVYPEHVVIEVLKWSVEQFLKFNLSGLGVTNCDIHKGGALVKPAFLDRAFRNLIAERILFF